MNELKYKQHNVSILLYHIVCPVKYRRAVITAEVDKKLKEICLEIEKRLEIKFLEIGTEIDHVHFLVQIVPVYAPSAIVKRIKNITARKIFEACPEVRKQLWGREFWTRVYYIETVGEHGDESVISEYVKRQGRDMVKYKEVYCDKQLTLFG